MNKYISFNWKKEYQEQKHKLNHEDQKKDGVILFFLVLILYIFFGTNIFNTIFQIFFFFGVCYILIHLFLFAYNVFENESEVQTPTAQIIALKMDHSTQDYLYLFGTLFFGIWVGSLLTSTWTIYHNLLMIIACSLFAYITYSLYEKNMMFYLLIGLSAFGIIMLILNLEIGFPLSQAMIIDDLVYDQNDLFFGIPRYLVLMYSQRFVFAMGIFAIIFGILYLIDRDEQYLRKLGLIAELIFFISIALIFIASNFTNVDLRLFENNLLNILFYVSVFIILFFLLYVNSKNDEIEELKSKYSNYILGILLIVVLVILFVVYLVENYDFLQYQ